jgi:orotidine-5'-phosphate decarboxylase
VSERVASQAATWNSRDNVGLVAGATYPEQLRSIRSVAGDMPILVPGVGAQQGDLAAAVRAGLDSDGFGLIINTSRAVCYASDGPDFAEAARAVALRLCSEIEQAKAASLQTA